jgi:NADH-quinone oxidoreductase subunit E
MPKTIVSDKKETKGKLTKEKSVLNAVFKKYNPGPGSLIPVLQDIQDELNYLPEECLREAADRLDVSLKQVFSVATFYNAFSLLPKGKYVIQVCMGTACHVRGGLAIVEEVERILGIKRGETTKDKKFTLETVNCLGACALGPIMTINGTYHGHLKLNKIKKILKEYK